MLQVHAFLGQCLLIHPYHEDILYTKIRTTEQYIVVTTILRQWSTDESDISSLILGAEAFKRLLELIRDLTVEVARVVETLFSNLCSDSFARAGRSFRFVP